MTQVFLRLFNISTTAGWIVLAAMAVRLLFRKMPRWGYCLLWGIVGLRLLLPFTLESSLSLLPSPELIPPNIAVSENPAIHSGIPVVNKVINPIFVTEPVRQNISLEQLLQWASWLWLAGLVLLLAYGLVSYCRLCRQVRISVPTEGNVYLCDGIQSPFLLGIFKPRIYIPSGLEEQWLSHILAHERAHIQRRDHLWKPLGFLLLCIYWFNPFLWAGYILLCRDIERACDEKVIAQKDNLFRLNYMNALVSCSLHRRMILACPVAFGEVSVKTRIKGITRYKKPTLTVILASALTCAVACICFLTTPKACAHDYTSETTLQATCTEHGVQTNTCRLCNHTYMQTTACLTHTYDEGRITIEPTCVRAGLRIRNCTDCGHKGKEEVPMIPHTPSKLTLTKEPNCVQTGIATSVCTFCRIPFIAQILPVNDTHQWERTVIKPATCTQDGKAQQLCTRCGLQEEEIIKSSGHNYEVLIIHPASCLSDGSIQQRCTVCKKKKFTVLHSEDVPHKNVGATTGICYDCGRIVADCYYNKLLGEFVRR